MTSDHFPETEFSVLDEDEIDNEVGNEIMVLNKNGLFESNPLSNEKETYSGLGNVIVSSGVAGTELDLNQLEFKQLFCDGVMRHLASGNFINSY